MPYYPELTVIQQQRLMTDTFLGLNKGLSIQDGEMADMENLTGDNAPVLTTRQRRTLVEWQDGKTSFINPQGILGGDTLVTVDDGKVYVDGTEIAGLELSNDDAMQPKHLVGMGAYVCIWPDKKYVNLADTTDCGDMGVNWYATSTPTAVMCRLDGTEYDTTEITQADAAPENPEQGMLWLDTSGDNHVLKQYSTIHGWVQVATTYIKISADGIGKGVRVNDTVWLTNAKAVAVLDESTEAAVASDTTETGTLSFSIGSVGLTSKWTGTKNASGSVIYSTPNTAETYRSVTVAGIPEGALVQSARVVYSVTARPYSGDKIRTINGTTISYEGGAVPVTVSGNGTVSIPFAFRAGGGIGGAGSHSAQLEITDITLEVTWAKTTAGGEDSGETTTTPPKEQDAKAIDALNTSCIVYGAGENYIIVVGLITQALRLDTALTLEVRIPDLMYVTEAGNRIWGCRYTIENGKQVNEILACALGDFRNWYSFMGTQADSYAVSVGSDGKFTAATTLKGYPIFFKESVMHRIAGSVPSNFQMITTNVRGVQDGCWRSVVQVGEYLYYKSRMAVMGYDGSVPQDVSAALGKERYYDAAGGRYGNKYYLSMRHETEGWSLFVYDTAKGLWHREDASEVAYFGNVTGDMYFIKDNTLLSVAGQTATTEADFPWSATFGIYGYSYEGQKYLSRFNIRAWMREGSRMRLEIMYDSDGEWHDEGEMRCTRTQSFMLPVIPRRCDHCQLRLSGIGEVKLFSIARILEYGGDG